MKTEIEAWSTTEERESQARAMNELQRQRRMRPGDSGRSLNLATVIYTRTPAGLGRFTARIGASDFGFRFNGLRAAHASSSRGRLAAL